MTFATGDVFSIDHRTPLAPSSEHFMPCRGQSFFWQCRSRWPASASWHTPSTAKSQRRVVGGDVSKFSILLAALQAEPP
jgi:hypothetical protein